MRTEPPRARKPTPNPSLAELISRLQLVTIAMENLREDDADFTRRVAVIRAEIDDVRERMAGLGG